MKKKSCYCIKDSFHTQYITVATDVLFNSSHNNDLRFYFICQPSV